MCFGDFLIEFGESGAEKLKNYKFIQLLLINYKQLAIFRLI